MLAARIAFEYGIFILVGMMFLWVLVVWRNPAIARDRVLRFLPLFASLMILVRFNYLGITITSPADHTVVHPGDKVAVEFKVTPSFLSHLYPWAGLDLYSCSTCRDTPAGVVTGGKLTGSPYTFTVSLPKDQPAGEIFVAAVAREQIGGRTVLRSKSIGLVVSTPPAREK